MLRLIPPRDTDPRSVANRSLRLGKTRDWIARTLIRKLTTNHGGSLTDRAHISTSHTERQNLTMRMQMRRFTRLTNAFSKKIENHEAAIALHYMHHNFARVHQTLRVTPAMEAGISNHAWTPEEIAGLLP